MTQKESLMSLIMSTILPITVFALIPIILLLSGCGLKTWDDYNQGCLEESSANCAQEQCLVKVSVGFDQGIPERAQIAYLQCQLKEERMKNG